MAVRWPARRGEIGRSEVNTMSLLLSAGRSGTASLKGFRTKGDGGGGTFYYDETEDRANHDGGTIIDPTNAADLATWDAAAKTTWFTAGSGTGCWIRLYGQGISPEWFDPDDVGSAINAIQNAFSFAGCKIDLAAKVYPCSTTINLDLTLKNTPISITGASATWRDRTAAHGGTVIDGSGMSADVINGALTDSNYGISLRDITVMAGSADGVVIGDGTFSSAGLVIDNLNVFGGVIGVFIADAFSSRIGKIYTFGQTGTGFKALDCNAASFSSITSRGCTGDWAIVLEGGKGVDFGVLYAESNDKGGIKVHGPMQGAVIQSLYLENNNKAGTAAYEVFLGDTTPDSTNLINLTINGSYWGAPDTAFSTARLGIDRVFQLNMNGMAAQISDFLKVIGSVDQRLTFSGCAFPTGAKSDFSDMFAQSSLVFIGCEAGATSDFTFPTGNVSVESIGCSLTLLRPFRVFTTSNYVMNAYETFVEADTASNVIQITLPPTQLVGDKIITVTNRRASGNLVTVVSPTSSIMGFASHTIGNNAGASYRFGEGRWLLVGEGAI